MLYKKKKESMYKKDAHAIRENSELRNQKVTMGGVVLSLQCILHATYLHGP